MSFQKHLMLHLAVNKLGAADKEIRSAKPTDNREPRLTTEVQALTTIPLSQRIGAAFRFRLKTILPFFLWTDQSR